ncbi:unannotated protein [freshwater metagenome]|uniref:Unannotated protein n=1 Tax=freshwater metagenome TaxID=449393 RepID=A0A6J6S078_9ZZZZ
MNSPGPENIAGRLVPSLDTDRSLCAAGEEASFWMTAAASRPASESMSTFASVPASVSETMSPPAPWTRALIHTT